MNSFPFSLFLLSIHHLSLQSPQRVSSLLTVFDFDPQEIARQLTLIDFSLFTKIKPEDLLNQVCTYIITSQM